MWRRADLTAEDELISELLCEALARLSTSLRGPAGCAAREQLLLAPQPIRQEVLMLAAVAKRGVPPLTAFKVAPSAPVRSMRADADEFVPTLRLEECLTRAAPLAAHGDGTAKQQEGRAYLPAVPVLERLGGDSPGCDVAGHSESGRQCHSLSKRKEAQWEEASAHREEKGAAEQPTTPHQGWCAPADAHREERAEEPAGGPEQKQELSAEEVAAAAQTPQPPLSRRVWLNWPALRALWCPRRKGSSPVNGPCGQSIPSNLGGVPPRGGFELCRLETTDLGLGLSPQLWSATKENMMTRQQAEVNNNRTFLNHFSVLLRTFPFLRK